MRAILPGGDGLPALLLVASVARRARQPAQQPPGDADPRPRRRGRGAGAVLAVLIGVNVGPNLTYVGSLATLLWRRVLHRSDDRSSCASS